MKETPSCSIFQEYDPDVDVLEKSHEELHTEDGFVNYAGVKDCEEVIKEMERLIDNDFCIGFNTKDEADHSAGGPVILSKIGTIRKVRGGKMKIRLVIDSKQSGVSRACRKQQCVALPRALDVTFDALDLLAYQDQQVELFIAEFADAFYQVPNHPMERRFFAVSFHGRFT